MRLKHQIKQLCQRIGLSLPALRRWNMRRRFRLWHGYSPDLERPRSLSEKLVWISLHHDLSALAPYVDKLLVRDFVRKRVGEKRLVPLLGVYDSFEDIDLARLPERFVIKATHGAGWNVVVPDKRTADWQDIRKKFERWLAENYGLISGESCYTPLRGRIVVEEHLESPPGGLHDFKFYCVDGEPLGLHVDFDRYGEHTYRVYDAQWTEFPKTGPVAAEPPVLARPENLPELLDVCRRLSTGFSFVRVDLYNPGDRISFGELTFLPSHGLRPFDPAWSDHYFGEKLDVRRYVPTLQESGPGGPGR